MLVRRKLGTDGPSAIRSASAPFASERRPSRRSAALPDGASTVTRCPSLRSSAATPATWSLTSWGTDQENGVTRQILIAERLVQGQTPSRVCPWVGPSGLRSDLCRRPRVLLDESLGVLARLVVADLDR